MLVSYMHIIWAILKIPSKEGRRKAFSTCSSHLCVVGLFFGIAMLVYMVPDSNQREEQEKILSLFHSLFNPMLNPLIYSLRNTQVKEALHRALLKKPM
jgi:olfactory receptor